MQDFDDISAERAKAGNGGRRVVLEYAPQPIQAALHACPANEILFGGAAGPGKSHALRFEALLTCLRVPGLRAYLFRRTMPELERNHILPALAQFPRSVAQYRAAKQRFEFINGSILTFCGCPREVDVFRYQGAELHALYIDELTSFTEFQYDYLRGRLRCAIEVPPALRHKVPGIVCASNPGGVGHGFAKARFVDFAPPGECRRAPVAEGGMLRCYLPGRLADNRILMERDPGYVARLEALPEPYRTAYLEGDWDVFMGQAFAFSRRLHVVKPRPVPDNAPLLMTFDWGYGAPFSVGWWWVDPDGRLYRFAEWYGSNGSPNQGLRLTDSQIAAGILAREATLSLAGRRVTRLCGPDCFAKKPDYRGGGQGPSTAEVFAGAGVYLAPGDPSRTVKIRQFHERLRPREDGPPMLQVYDTCEDFIRTLPLLSTDRRNVEDIDTTGEDHIYDEACHACMARPLTAGTVKTVDKPAAQLIDAVLADSQTQEEAP
ncbi:terminase large subunit domain-containing protein [Solidesulfovibrio aerotolerans]|uniref:terminase large subunit domain-containing protein n=1 Tax=Solidesulfovibrio aerotolerans TaxID=295255 RepID=UPI001BAE1FA3|nr:terminase family protein [Solidesulfovibrio aerotolerans]